MLLDEISLKQSKNIPSRPRRNRISPSIRGLVQETRLHPSDFVVPFFVVEGINIISPIDSMPGIFRYSIDVLLKKVKELYDKGIRAIDLFTIVPDEKKDARGSEAIRQYNLLQCAIAELKEYLPDLCVMADIALDPYTSHGHDGVINEHGSIMNDETLDILAEMSLLAAQSGADIVAPSDMMDGRVAYIREVLDSAGYVNTGICAYTAKYASAFYGPFRDALYSAPRFGDKKTYQMNPANRREALREALLDEKEGADMLLVKPGLPYLDILCSIKQSVNIPVGAYHVSGEYSMVMAAAERGWIDAEKVFEESLLSIKRAGADFIFTYAAPMILQRL